MHELSDGTKKLLDIGTVVLAGIAGITLNEVAIIVTIAAGAMSFACGAIRVFEFIERRRAKRAA